MKKIPQSYLFFGSFLVLLLFVLVVFWAFGKAKLTEYIDSLHTVQQKTAEIQSGSQNSNEEIVPGGETQMISSSSGESKTSMEGIVPIENASERVTKKPFGIYITPQTSPVQPERFLGYHTGTDFETFDDEKDKDVEIRAVCKGSVLEKKYVSGYGGVLVQSCSIENQPVTVLYGHLKLSSIDLSKGDLIESGQKIAILGQGNSQETDFERKHLHLAIHKGRGIDYRGYVSTEKELANWIDPMAIILK